MNTLKVWAVRGIFLAGLILMLAGCGRDEDYIYDEATYLVESYVQDQSDTWSSEIHWQY